MKVNYALLKSNHYSSNRVISGFKSKEDVYGEIGYNFYDLARQNPAYINTCAVRMSLALIKVGVHFTGRLKIKGGPYKGMMIEPGAKLLADQLARPTLFGRPAIFSSRDAMTRLRGKRGMVLFWKMSGYGGGHIDLIEIATTAQVCHSACPDSSKEIWFWSLS